MARHRQTLQQKMVADLDDSFNNNTATPRARIPRTIGVHGGSTPTQDTCTCTLVRSCSLVDGSILDPSMTMSDEVFDPWGRPGAGAPIKNDNGQVVATTQNHFNDKKQVTKH